MNAYSKTSILLFGGGGDPIGESTIFDQSLIYLNEKLLKEDFKLFGSAFDGGHEATEKLLSEKNLTFTLDNMNLLIDNVLKTKFDIDHNLLIIINTHGGTWDSTLLTHTIAMNNTRLNHNSDIKGPRAGNLDRLKEIVDYFSTQKGKLGILDFSCHSGNSLNIASKSTCIISSAGPHLFSYTDFSELFIQNLKSGASLFNIFLNTNKSLTSPAFPMMSGEYNNKFFNEYYPLISPYLYMRNGNAKDKLFPYLKKTILDNNLIKREEDFHLLLEKLNHFKDKITFTSKYVGTQNLIDALKEMKSYQDAIIQTLLHLHLKELSQSIKFNHELITYEDILFLYPESNLDYYVSLYKSSESSASEKKEYLNMIEKYKWIIKKRSTILHQYPGIENIPLVAVKLDQDFDYLWGLTNKVQELNGLLFEYFAKNLSSDDDYKNPCKNLIL